MASIIEKHLKEESKHMIPMACVQIDDESSNAVLEVLKSGQLAQGPKVEEFEKAFASYIGTRYAIAVNSGTAALHIALLAAGIGEGDEVITTPFSFIATSNCCLFVGAKPIFADIDDKTFNISPADIERKITPRTRAVIVVDLYGQPCDMNEISAICRKHGLVLIEDACQAHGAEYMGRKIGSFGLGCFSFYPTKNMTTGEGGMITTGDEEIYRKARLARQHGQSRRYVHDTLGYNLRMTDIAAVLGICQLRKLDAANQHRARNAAFLSDNLRSVPGILTPHTAPHRSHVFHQYTIKITPDFKYTRDELPAKLLERGIGTMIYYPVPIHLQEFYRKLGYNDSLPVAESVAGQVLSLPVHPGVSQEDLHTIVKAIKEA